MDFEPPRCPNRQCRKHREPGGRFYRRHGSFKASCRDEPVPRFRCKSCWKTFSRQTFRIDYWDHKPQCNARLLECLISGVGLRQAARIVGLGVHAVQHKFRKIGIHLRLLNRNLLRELPGNRIYLLDELETHEGSLIGSLTVPVLIDKETRLVVAALAARIRRSTKKGSRRADWQARVEAKNGKRKDRSKRCVRLALQRLKQKLGGNAAVLHTDEKPMYATLARQVFGEQLVHEAFSGRAERTTWNPLFVINHTDAMLRDNCGRLRRKTWLISKKVRFLRLQLALFAVYRNWVRPRNNGEDSTPGEQIGLVSRRLAFNEVLAWRQDWGQRSIHPISASGRLTIAEAAV